jgi:hypothetical protein
MVPGAIRCQKCAKSRKKCSLGAVVPVVASKVPARGRRESRSLSKKADGKGKAREVTPREATPERRITKAPRRKSFNRCTLRLQFYILQERNRKPIYRTWTYRDQVIRQLRMLRRRSRVVRCLRRHNRSLRYRTRRPRSRSLISRIASLRLEFIRCWTSAELFERRGRTSLPCLRRSRGKLCLVFLRRRVAHTVLVSCAHCLALYFVSHRGYIGSYASESMNIIFSFWTCEI